MSVRNFQFKVDINVINHLGVGLYSSTPAALAELVANSWDAEAENVEITITSDESIIIIRDDGHGMNITDVEEKFLNVGFSRRGADSSENKSLNHKRFVMGRKGIGKLAMLALSEEVIISTQKEGEPPVSFKIEVEKFKKDIQERGESDLQGMTVESNYFPKGHGTEIKLINTHTSITTTASYLKRRLARRFSVKPEGDDLFNIKINGQTVSHSDRGYYDKIKYLWSYDKESLKKIESIANLKRNNIENIEENSVTELNNKVFHKSEVLKDGERVYKEEEFEIRGFIASVKQPSDLGKKDESANMISIFVNGKVFAEDILAAELGDAKYFNNYLTGEIHADFLDRDSIDRATANREAIKKQDPLYRSLILKLQKDMITISSEWDEWRRDAPLDENQEETDAIKGWVDSLSDRRDRKTALRIMSTIQKSYQNIDAEEEKRVKRILYQNVIVGFQSLKLRGDLDKLDKIRDVLSPEFQEIFLSLNHLESIAYAEITRERLEVIKKFDEIVGNPDILEKVAQQYLFDHLWLLEPSWDRVSMETSQMELRITEKLKDKRILGNSDSRLDIAYRQSSGHHIIVELKRPKKSIPTGDILVQVGKYNKAFKEYYKQNGKIIPPFSIYMLINKRPDDWDKDNDDALAAMSGRILTYENLIKAALETYQKYFDASAKVIKVDEHLKKFDKLTEASS